MDRYTHTHSSTKNEYWSVLSPALCMLLCCVQCFSSICSLSAGQFLHLRLPCSTPFFLSFGHHHLVFLTSQHLIYLSIHPSVYLPIHHLLSIHHHPSTSLFLSLSSLFLTLTLCIGMCVPESALCMHTLVCVTHPYHHVNVNHALVVLAVAGVMVYAPWGVAVIWLTSLVIAWSDGRALILTPQKQAVPNQTWCAISTGMHNGD